MEKGWSFRLMLNWQRFKLRFNYLWIFITSREHNLTILDFKTWGFLYSDWRIGTNCTIIFMLYLLIQIFVSLILMEGSRILMRT